MSLSHFSFRRPVTSYSKVQAFVSWLIRGRRFQLRSSRVTSRQYLDVGCGTNTHEPFINLEYAWHPGIDLCWDVSRGIPLATGSLQCIFTEHCLEHFSLPVVRFLLGEFRRLLQPGGTLRIAVPDAGLYLAVYRQKLDGHPTARFPYEASDLSGGLVSPMVSVNRIFYTDRESPAGHRCMFDEGLLAELLSGAGFVGVQRTPFRQGRDAVLLIDSAIRQVESLYMEATTRLDAS